MPWGRRRCAVPQFLPSQQRNAVGKLLLKELQHFGLHSARAGCRSLLEWSWRPPTSVLMVSNFSTGINRVAVKVLSCTHTATQTQPHT